MGGGEALSLSMAGVLLFVSGVLYFGSILWAAIDAADRDRSGCLIGILVFFTWPLGLLIWLVARPPKTT